MLIVYAESRAALDTVDGEDVELDGEQDGELVELDVELVELGSAEPVLPSDAEEENATESLRWVAVGTGVGALVPVKELVEEPTERHTLHRSRPRTILLLLYLVGLLFLQSFTINHFNKKVAVHTREHPHRFFFTFCNHLTTTQLRRISVCSRRRVPAVVSPREISEFSHF
jgi:hypothetical protein